MSLDYSAYPILYVDDEQQNLVSFQYALEAYFSIVTVRTGEEALRVLAEQEIAVLLADQRMPGMNGVEVCRRAREVRPQAIRMILTAYADLHAAIDAINQGHVSRYLVKPWRNEEIIETLRTAIDLVHIQRTVQSLEMRLLRGSQSSGAVLVFEELLHELTNPLGALDINSALIADLLGGASHSLSDPPRAQNLLAAAVEAHSDSMIAVSQLKSLINRARQGRRPAPANRDACDAARVVDATTRLLRHEVETVARLELALEASPRVAIEASVLGQVVLNLVLNAVQAMRPESKAENRIRVRVGEAGGQGVVAVSDNGVGIPPESLERVFDPFFTTKETGTGVGLAISRELVMQAGGTISAESEAGRGATFTIVLPLAGA